MKMNLWKLPLATVLCMGILLTVATGTTLASEKSEQGSFWDHQEMKLSVNADDSLPNFASAAIPETFDGLKKMLQSNGEDAAVQVPAELLVDKKITIERPVDLLVKGYDALSAKDQKNIKLVVELSGKLPENAPLAMTIQGIPEDHMEVRNLGPVSLYTTEVAETLLAEEPKLKADAPVQEEGPGTTTASSNASTADDAA